MTVLKMLVTEIFSRMILTKKIQKTRLSLNYNRIF